MNVLRNKRLSTGFIAFWCVIFLNMSFFMIEISALKLKQDRKLVENVKKLINTVTAEEEPDASESTEGLGGAKEVDFVTNNLNHNQHHQISTELQYKTLLFDRGTHPGHTEPDSPPPDALSLA